MINLRKLPRDPAIRFESSYMPEPMSGCWLWLGTVRGSNDYGRFEFKGKAYVAHRYSYEKSVGPIPEGMLVCHRCDNSACVNPNHLFLGTHQDNSDDKIAKGRHAKGEKLGARQRLNSAKGARNANNKLTNAQVLEIFSSRDAQRTIAARFGVSQALVWHIKNGVTWSWLTKQ